MLPIREAVLRQRAQGLRNGHDYDHDSEALLDFLTVNWGWTEPPDAVARMRRREVLQVPREKVLLLWQAVNALCGEAKPRSQWREETKELMQEVDAYFGPAFEAPSVPGLAKNEASNGGSDAG